MTTTATASRKSEVNSRSFNILAIFPTHLVRCRRTLLELTSYEPYPSLGRERKFRRD